MTTLLIALGGLEIGMILLIILILFGARRLPGLFRGIAKGIKEFKAAKQLEEKGD